MIPHISKDRGTAMHYHISLRFRLLLLISAVVLINIIGSLGTVWYMHRTQSIYSEILDQDINSMVAAQKLATELVMQKGLTTYFFLTNDQKWLEQLQEGHRKFQKWLGVAREVNRIEEARSILNEIESHYIRYSFDRDQVIELYKGGKREEGAALHWRVRDQFFEIYRLTERFKSAHENQIAELRKKFKASSQQMSVVAWSAIPCVILISIALALTLFRQILQPIRELAAGEGQDAPPHRIDDEVKAIRKRMDELLVNISQTQAKLHESQEHLIQTEKLARVGKLAAGVAHSVRNPLTSVKMRLFTLERSLQMTADQKEDLDVISEEIRHIDTILRNFLEFARPPKLKVHPFSMSDVVDLTLQLLRHRFDSYQASVSVKRSARLPDTPIDSDQMKEVLVNIMVNACEAMGEGGSIQIEEAVGSWPALGDAVLIQIHDNGPGIAPAIMNKMFEPFFSSKEEGSGLGLSIVKRIIEEHGGDIQVHSEEGAGTTFTIALPNRTGRTETIRQQEKTDG